MSDVPLGRLAGPEAERDAIHVAIAPVVAGEQMYPGQHVGFVGDSAETVGPGGNCIGIVDPFLTHPVPKGKKFFLCLYPQTVAGMRHHWQHPAFEPMGKPTGPVKGESEAFIEHIAGQCGLTYDRMLQVARDYVETGEYERDNSQMYDSVDYRLWPEFWRHFEAVTGVEVEEHDAVPFTCSC